jgi:antitoxin PrlF
MRTTIVNSKWQITIPVNVRRTLQLGLGDRIEFVEIEPGRFEFCAANRSVKELKGMFGKPVRRVSIEEMNKMNVTPATSG